MVQYNNTHVYTPASPEECWGRSGCHFRPCHRGQWGQTGWLSCPPPGRPLGAAGLVVTGQWLWRPAAWQTASAPLRLAHILLISQRQREERQRERGVRNKGQQCEWAYWLCFPLISTCKGKLHVCMYVRTTTHILTREEWMLPFTTTADLKEWRVWANNCEGHASHTYILYVCVAPCQPLTETLTGHCICRWLVWRGAPSSSSALHMQSGRDRSGVHDVGPAQKASWEQWNSRPVRPVQDSHTV